MRYFLVCSLAAVIVAATVAACGSSNGTSSGGSAASASPVKIGVVEPENAPGLSLPEVQAVAEQTASYLNKSGGLAGHSIQIDYCNDMVEPNQTVACARKLVGDHVIAQVGGAVVLGQVFNPILLKAGIPVIGKTPLTAGDFTDANEYNFGGGVLFGYQGLLGYAAHNIGPVSFVYLATPNATRLVGELKSTMKAAGGHLANTVNVSPTQADFAPIVAASRANGAKGVILGLGQQQIAAYLQAAKSAGVTSANFTIATSGESLPAADRRLLGPDAQHYVYNDYFPPYTTSTLPLMQTFRQILQQGGGTGPLGADIQSDASFATFLGLEAIKKIVEQQGVKELTASTLTAALNNTHKLDLGGVVPPWTPNAAGPKTAPRVPVSDQWYIRYDARGTPLLLFSHEVSVPDAISGKFG